VLIPEIAYPTYHLGAVLAGAESVPVAIDAKSWPAADLAWLNSPSNPTGRVHSIDEIKACIDWSRKNKSVLISDECYLEFDHTAHSVSVLSQTGATTSIFWRYIHYQSVHLWLAIVQRFHDWRQRFDRTDP
jgi:aspartate/methionine/tyrosine aminotransferase